MFEIESRIAGSRQRLTEEAAVRTVRALLRRLGNEANEERVVKDLLSLSEGKEMYVTYGVSIRRMPATHS